MPQSLALEAIDNSTIDTDGVPEVIGNMCLVYGTVNLLLNCPIWNEYSNQTFVNTETVHFILSEVCRMDNSIHKILFDLNNNYVVSSDTNQLLLDESVICSIINIMKKHMFGYEEGGIYDLEEILIHVIDVMDAELKTFLQENNNFHSSCFKNISYFFKHIQ